MASQITQDQIIEMNELYLQIGTYAGVSRAMGGRPAPSTVKKYIIPNYTSQRERNHKEISLPSIEDTIEALKKWKYMTSPTEDEREEIKDLWKDMVI